GWSRRRRRRSPARRRARRPRRGGRRRGRRGSRRARCRPGPLAPRALRGRGRPLGRDAGRSRLPDAYAHMRDREPGRQGVRDGRRQGLDQVDPHAVGDVLHGRGHLTVVDGRLDPVLVRLCDLERDVEEEGLALPLLLLEHAVATEDLEAVELDDHASIASATVNASTVSRTSWTRRIAAPRSKAATAAATLAAREPVVASGSPSRRPSELLRDRPTRTGRPSPSRTSSRRTSSTFCSTVLPYPMPGSRQMRPSAIPAATASRSRSSRKAATSDTTSWYRGAACIVPGSPCMCIRQRYASASATTAAISSSPRRAVTSLTSSAPSASARRATSALEVSIDTGSPWSSSSTGTTRRSSTSSGTPAEPGRVDSPPTSTIAA